MWKLFEDFVIGFYRRERRDFTVRGRTHLLERHGRDGRNEPRAGPGHAGRSDPRVQVSDSAGSSWTRSSTRPCYRAEGSTQATSTSCSPTSATAKHAIRSVREHEGILLYAQTDERVRAEIRLEGFSHPGVHGGPQP